MINQAVARTDFQGKPCQTVQQHLEEVASLTAAFAAKIGMPVIGELLGLLHDMGKYGRLFREAIKEALDSQDKDSVTKPDHSTAGAQIVWQALMNGTPLERGLGQVLAQCICSHHSGLIDCLSPSGEATFLRRMEKDVEKTCLHDVRETADPAIAQRIDDLIQSGQAVKEFELTINALNARLENSPLRCFHLGLIARFLFSVLIDADRLSAAGRSESPQPPWQGLVDKLERRLATFETDSEVNIVRAEVAESCLRHAERPKGLYRLTVPTGGGKTLSSLRFALRHAAKHDMERIVYVIPYTSIIDQNADVARTIFEEPENKGSVVLEHHSNLTEEEDTEEKHTEESRLLAENWDAPIVFTTMVQFLDAFYQKGTRAARRVHRLANAVIIFDEVQTLPIKTVHLFNNAANFLVTHCGASVVFCTATQPLLEGVDPNKGAAKFSGGEDAEIAPSRLELFRRLRRVDVRDECKPSGWTYDEIGERLVAEALEARTVLAVTNTKSAARALYECCASRVEHVFHLSTYMCPAHRMKVLDRIKEFLEPDRDEGVLCISTQLIEAGVDIDFGAVVRFLAGLDSIAQAAGRCNRNGLRDSGRVTIVNPRRENLGRLPDIRIGCGVSARILREFQENPAAFDHDILSPTLMQRYYRYYFYDRAEEMDYCVGPPHFDRDDTLFSLLSCNDLSIAEAVRTNTREEMARMLLRQSFRTAGKAFDVIDSGTIGVITTYDEGQEIIGKLYANPNSLEAKRKLLRHAQRYSVNLYRHEIEKLGDGAVNEIFPGSGIYCLAPKFYSDATGVVFEPSEPDPVLIVCEEGT